MIHVLRYGVTVIVPENPRQMSEFQKLRQWQLGIVEQHRAETRAVLDERMRAIVAAGGDHHTDGWPCGADGTYLEMS